jgi:Family of unknown function (DUF5994)
MTLTTRRHLTAVSTSAPSTPRLRLEPTGSRHTVLDGGWWPRSTDPVAELPGLVMAIDKVRGPVTRLVLSANGWDEHPRRLAVAGRVLRLGFFTSQPMALLTALCGDNGDRVDLLIVPPETDASTADAAMVLAATTSNLVHAEQILLAAITARLHDDDGGSEDVWESDGGRLRITSSSPRPQAAHAAGLAATHA